MNELSKNNSSLGIDPSIKTKIWAENGNVLCYAGKFWKMLLSYSVGLFTNYKLSFGSTANLEKVISLLSLSFDLQKNLYKKKYSTQDIFDLSEMIFGWKKKLISVFKNLEIKTKPINFLFPNFDNSMYHE